MVYILIPKWSLSTYKMVGILTINACISTLQNVQYLCYSNYKMVPIVNTKWRIYPYNTLNFQTPKWSISTLQNGSYPTTKLSIPLLSKLPNGQYIYYPNYKMVVFQLQNGWYPNHIKVIIQSRKWSLSKLQNGRYSNYTMVGILATKWSLCNY